MASYFIEKFDKNHFWKPLIPATTSEDEARHRLDAILSDRLLWFNPYRIPDRALLDCAERGRWSPFPAITQMMVFHFHDIRTIKNQRDIPTYDALFFHIGDTETEHYFSVKSMVQSMTHRASRRQIWTIVNNRHLVSSKINSLEGKSLFVSHAINCERPRGDIRQAYRMHRLNGSDAMRAATIRESMCAAKITMLEEIMQFPIHPDYLGNACQTFDYTTPLLQAIATIRRFPSVTPPTTHTL